MWAMNTLDDIFKADSDTVLHPKARWWKKRHDAGDQLSVELYRPDATLGLSLTKMAVHRVEGGKEQDPDTMEWDDELNAELVRLGVKAINLQQEGERFALALKAALRKVERKYGDGYLNAVLVDL